MNINLQIAKAVQGTANTLLIEDEVNGSNGTALIFRFNQLADLVEGYLRTLAGGYSSYLYTYSSQVALDGTSHIVGVRTTPAALVLPPLTSVDAGYNMYVVNEAGTGTITLSTGDGSHINGGATLSVTTRAHLYCNGSNWFSL